MLFSHPPIFSVQKQCFNFNNYGLDLSVLKFSIEEFYYLEILLIEIDEKLNKESYISFKNVNCCAKLEETCSGFREKNLCIETARTYKRVGIVVA